MNLYAFCGNDAVNTWDANGGWRSWWIFDQHSDITNDALKNLDIAKHVIECIIEGNLYTDKNDEYFKELHRHFNREMDEDYEKALIDYMDLLQEEKRIILSILKTITDSGEDCDSKEKCEEALFHMGILSHMGQDFFRMPFHCKQLTIR